MASARSPITERESCSSAANWISSRSYSATESPEEPNFNSTGEALYLYGSAFLNLDATSKVTVAGTLVFRAGNVSTLDFANSPMGGRVSVSAANSLLKLDDQSAGILNIGSGSNGTTFAGVALGDGGRLNIDDISITLGSAGLAIWPGGGRLNLTNGSVVTVQDGPNSGEQYFYSSDALSLQGGSQLNFTRSGGVTLRFRGGSVNSMAFANFPTAGKVSLPTASTITLGDEGGSETLSMTGPVTVSALRLDGTNTLTYTQGAGDFTGLTASSLAISLNSVMNLVLNDNSFTPAVGYDGTYTWLGEDPTNWILRLAGGGNRVGDLNTMVSDGRIVVTAVPEPGVGLLALVGILPFLVRRRARA